MGCLWGLKQILLAKRRLLEQFRDSKRRFRPSLASLVCSSNQSNSHPTSWFSHLVLSVRKLCKGLWSVQTRITNHLVIGQVCKPAGCRYLFAELLKVLVGKLIPFVYVPSIIIPWRASTTNNPISASHYLQLSRPASKLNFHSLSWHTWVFHILTQWWLFQTGYFWAWPTPTRTFNWACLLSLASNDRGSAMPRSISCLDLLPTLVPKLCHVSQCCCSQETSILLIFRRIVVSRNAFDQGGVCFRVFH